MATKRAGRGRPKNAVPTDKHCYIRMTSADHELVTEAISHMLGPRSSVSRFLLWAGTEKAREILRKGSTVMKRLTGEDGSSSID
jgi:hypothetical protein